MKCIRNKKTGDIIRVEDKTAYSMAGSTWEYVSKTIWRKSQGLDKDVAETATDASKTTEKVESKKQKKKNEVHQQFI